MAPLLLLACLSLSAAAQNLSTALLSDVTDRLAEGAKQSWELGTRAQALLEYTYPALSVFSSTSLPPSAFAAAYAANTSFAAAANTQNLSTILAIAQDVVAARAASNGNIAGPQPLVADGSAADPASIGVAVLLANWTGFAHTNASALDYAGAAADQRDYLLTKVPRTADGAISHRVSEVQLWSDFVYMVPPFLAYYGVVTDNKTLVTEAYNQVKLYRTYLRDANSSSITNATGLWKHILLGGTAPDSVAQDPGFWSTGNAWAAAGMLRVLATITHAPPALAGQFKSELSDLGTWVGEIHQAMYAAVDATAIFTNYATTPVSAPGMFYDSAATALLAATVYRASVLGVKGAGTYIPHAERARTALGAAGTPASSPPSSSSSSSSSPPPASPSSASAHSTSTSTSTSTSPAPSAPTSPSRAHFTADGWLTPVVDPHAFGVQGSDSPEAQAFVLELQAAWGDWVAAGARVGNGAGAGARGVCVGAAMALVVGVLGLGV